MKRLVRQKGQIWGKERLSMAIEYVDGVHLSVLRHGADLVINNTLHW